MRTIKPLIALAIVGFFAAAIARADEPTPPQQGAPWTPPETSLPKEFVAAARTLFEQGLADPRGCEYRSIRISGGGLAGFKAELFQTTGWVIPAKGGEPPYAIAWNGLIYPLVDPDAPADLDADIHALDEFPVSKSPSFWYTRRKNDDQRAAATLGSLQPIQICLLFRFGRVDLAEALWARVVRSYKPDPDSPAAKHDYMSYNLNYLPLATDYAWFRFSRALSAHARGDDPAALADLRALDAFREAVDAKADAMMLQGRKESPGGRKMGSPYIDFLDQLPELLADQERRARERAHPLPPPAKGDKVTPLIRDLDQVTISVWHSPGGAYLGESPVIKGLIAIGDDAVEPLIQVLRSDDRLTRAVAPARFPERGAWVLGVDRPAGDALRGILKTTQYASPPPDQESGGPPSRAVIADRIQAYWDKNKGFSAPERWYRTLADDQAGVNAWLEAAGYIAQPENITTVGGRPGAGEMTRVEPKAPGENPPLRGESLRAKHSPTVTELMTRRLKSIADTPANRKFGIGRSVPMARFLAAWDPAAAAPALDDLLRAGDELRAQDRAKNPRDNRTTLDDLTRALVELTKLRNKIGDH